MFWNISNSQGHTYCAILYLIIFHGSACNFLNFAKSLRIFILKNRFGQLKWLITPPRFVFTPADKGSELRRLSYPSYAWVLKKKFEMSSCFNELVGGLGTKLLTAPSTLLLLSINFLSSWKWRFPYWNAISLLLKLWIKNEPGCC